MADISKITLPSNTTYDIKDATARQSVEGKQDTITANGILQGDGSGNITAAASSTADTLNNPTTNGTYVLQNTVSSGSSTLSWGTGGGSSVTTADSATTGISIADHSTTTIYGVQSSTTTASKASGANGSAPTLGTAFTIPNVTSAGSASNWIFEDVTVPKAAVSATTVPIKDTNATSIPNVTAVGSGSFSATVLNHVLSFSHTHTAPTLGTAISVTGVQSSTTSVTGVSGSVTGSHVKSGGNGTAPSLGTAFIVPNVTNAGSASTWSFSDVDVPIKNTSSTTVVTGKTHTVTDNGHTHTLS